MDGRCLTEVGHRSVEQNREKSLRYVARMTQSFVNCWKRQIRSANRETMGNRATMLPERPTAVFVLFASGPTATKFKSTAPKLLVATAIPPRRSKSA
ncbi:hypothetical protein RSSM_05031 [Rhodopirellula sallentina SM41]|uniref:Uncharacterized protein n=1 Tax=Rhodopirellula sallentina SM41 TaxID=1263870 RepID=M5TWV2_9BACT|nr:hypothetical protein RSSM_05031 [Rhodopirellula sallentina SM41]